MKTVLIVSLFIFHVSIAISQKKNNLSLKKEQEIYRISRMFNDNQISKYACYNLIDCEGILSDYKDSLAVIYLEEKNYQASLTLSEELLKNKPSTLALKINAYSLKGLNRNEDAYYKFKELINLEKKKSYVYELALLEFQLGDIESALSSIDYAFALYVDDIKTVKFQLDTSIYDLTINDALNCLKVQIYLRKNDDLNLKKVIPLVKNERLLNILMNVDYTVNK